MEGTRYLVEEKDGDSYYVFSPLQVDDTETQISIYTGYITSSNGSLLQGYKNYCETFQPTPSGQLLPQNSLLGYVSPGNK